jgi:hypothetical protein
MSGRLPAPRHDQTAIRRARESSDGALYLTRIAYANRAHLHPERLRRGLDCAELANPSSYGGFPKDRHSRDARRDLLEQFKPFAA